MALDQNKYSTSAYASLRDTRTLGKKLYDWGKNSNNAAITFVFIGGAALTNDIGIMFSDLAMVCACLFFWWLWGVERLLPYKLPAFSRFKSDSNNTGGGRSGKPEGIMYIGNNKDGVGEEIWFSNEDIRTHMLYLGTTGAGKTEGLKSLATNALCWGSGFVYIDGKADTDLWSSLSSLCRRFGRDDDLMVVNFMTGNSDVRAASNSMNPFSSGSAAYLANMLESLMPEAGGDNAMWKERAVALLRTVMPALTWQRDNLEIPMSISTIRQSIDFREIIKLSRNDALPKKIRDSIMGYLDTLPGYVDAAFDDNGREKPMGPDVPQSDPQVPMQQHGYLTMQFTRSLQSLADDYSYIFEVANADIDMVDIVLNRRILVVLLPALEKSGDETANLGKIIASTLKGMMGSTLGADVEGAHDKVIENKPTNSNTPFLTVFDEVGYYVTDGMAVMAAQARSLGFSLVYAAQDLSALEKRVKEEARSITANCNIKIFGKLSDPITTREFFEKTLGQALVTQASGFEMKPGSLTGSYESNMTTNITDWDKIYYSDAAAFKEGQAALTFSNVVTEMQFFYCNPDKLKAMRVQKFLGFEKTDDYVMKNLKNIAALRDRLAHKSWTAAQADVKSAPEPQLETIIAGMQSASEAGLSSIEQGAMALAHLYVTENPDALKSEDKKKSDTTADAQGEKTDQKESSDQSGKTDMSWSEIMADDTNNGDDEAEGQSDGNADSMVKPKAEAAQEITQEAAAPYSAEDAVNEKAESGLTILPDNLSDEVKEILKTAADNVTAGLFSKPSLDRYGQGGQGDSKGHKAKNVSPAQKPPGQGGR